MDLKEEDILGAGIGSHWYYRSKAAALRRAVGRPRAEAPARCRCGLGLLLAPSARARRRPKARSASTSAMPSDRDDSVAGKPVRYRRDTGPTDCDLVLMMDVLEHVDDDRWLVRHYAEKVPSGAHFLGDGARLRLPVERPRRLPRAQAPLSPARDRDRDARRRPRDRARQLLFRLRLSAGGRGAPRRPQHDRAAQQPEEAGRRSPTASSPPSAPPNSPSSR